MPISRASAQRLCTSPEFDLVEASFPANAKQLTPSRLRQKVARARRLRDKYRDLAKRQRLEARGKRAPQRSRPAQGHENTDRKAQLFQETLDRFETQLQRMDAAPSDAAQKRPPKKPTTGASGTSRASGAKSTTARTGAQKGGAGQVRTADASAAAKPAEPAKAGPAALKGARRNVVRGPEDASARARGKVARAHTRSANRRNQSGRDRRN